MSDFRDGIASGDPRKVREALLAQLAAKMDAGQCMHCGGPRGETAGLASIAREIRAIQAELEGMPDASKPHTSLDEVREARERRIGKNPKSDAALNRREGTGTRRPRG